MYAIDIQKEAMSRLALPSLLFFLALLPASSHGAPPARAIIWPDVPVPAPPAPVPHTPICLTSDLIFVIQSDTPLVVVASPQGVVNVTAESGPLKVRAGSSNSPR